MGTFAVGSALAGTEVSNLEQLFSCRLSDYSSLDHEAERVNHTIPQRSESS